MTRAAAMALAAALAACAPAPDLGEKQPGQVGPVGPSQPFSTLVQEIIVPRCATASCHSGAFPQAYPPLDADLAHGALVNAPSFQAPMDLVEPFDPANSYLVLKLRDVAGTVGSVGTPMPIGDALLEEADIQAIETWILNGAPND
ncbi:MAG TPA: hypothetical protein VLC54_20370 [Anaeromyxobacter sp.]|nr:hypothetical protein [Anaeromyxobacter sp.]